MKEFEEIIWFFTEPTGMNFLISLVSFVISFFFMHFVVDGIKHVADRALEYSEATLGATLFVLYSIGAISGVWLVLSFFWFVAMFVNLLF